MTPTSAYDVFVLASLAAFIVFMFSSEPILSYFQRRHRGRFERRGR